VYKVQTKEDSVNLIVYILNSERYRTSTAKITNLYESKIFEFLIKHPRNSRTGYFKNIYSVEAISFFSPLFKLCHFFVWRERTLLNKQNLNLDIWI
jgi:hypothetical protein